MRNFVIGLCACSAIVSSASAQTFDFNTLAHGEIVNTQFSPVMTVSAINPNRSHDLAAAFDTTLMGTADPDLEGPPWSGGNLAVSDTKVHLGMALIIAENAVTSGNGILTDPDDEGSRPAGDLIFDFSSTISQFGFDVIDIEGVIEESSSIEFFRGGSSVASVNFAEFTTGASMFFDATVVFGNNHANRVSPITEGDLIAAGFGSASGGFDRVVIHVGGSAAFDNVTIPAPSGVALLGLGGLVASRRRR